MTAAKLTFANGGSGLVGNRVLRGVQFTSAAYNDDI